MNDLHFALLLVGIGALLWCSKTDEAMKALTRQTIKELQPTAFGYAEERGAVLGGYEMPSDWDGDIGPLRDAAKRDFSDNAVPDTGEPCDGDGCIHVIIILPFPPS